MKTNQSDESARNSPLPGFFAANLLLLLTAGGCFSSAPAAFAQNPHLQYSLTMVAGTGRAVTPATGSRTADTSGGGRSGTLCDYESTVISQGPAGYWRLNETLQPPAPTPAANQGSLGASANGVYNNFPTRGLPGPFAGSVALGLSGASQSVTTPWQDGLNPSAFSVELWVNPAQVPKFAYIASSVEVNGPRSGWYLAQDDGSTFGLGSAFVVRMFYQNGSTPAITLSAPVNTAGVWYHLVLTYDGTTATLYVNGAVAQSGTPAGYVADVGAQTSFGCRADNNYYWPGEQAEVAMYAGALSAARVSAHYSAGTTTPATYVAAVQADSPVLWYRFTEAPEVTAANSSTADGALDGRCQYGTAPGGAGPRQAAYPGFDAANDAVTFPGTGASVSLPALNLNTNTVTISGWINASGNTESALAGLIACDGASTGYSGLILDLNGTGLGYSWNNDGNTYNWIPSDPVNFGGANLPLLPTSDWAYVALVVQPDQAWVYLCASNNPAGFAGATNFFAHVIEPFADPTLIGSDANNPSYSFAGKIDEVAIWNRALGVGELYTQYGAAVGGVGPRVFGDLQGPSGPIAAGDPIVLSVDAGGTPPLTFTWHANGATAATTSSNTLVIANSSLGDNGTYDVTIANASGSAQSSQVSVTVVNPTLPTIVQLQGYQSRTLYPAGTLRMAVMATGGGLKYQWYKNSSPIDSATCSAYTVPHVLAADGGSYSVNVTNLVGAATSGPPAVITIGTVTAGSYETAIINTAGGAPEAWWRLDEPPGSTNMFDAMGRHDGVYTNANGSGPLPTLGVAGALPNDSDTAASFSSTGEGIGLVPYSAALNPPQFSVEAWVNTTVTDGQAPVSSSYDNGGWWMQSASGWWLGNSSGGTFGNNGNVNTNAAIVPGDWSHIVITYDSSRVIGGTHYPYQLWVNGQTDGYVWGGPALNALGPFIIGARGVSATTLASLFFDGKVDEVAFYKRLLTSTEIQAHFQGCFAPVAPVPISPNTPGQSTTPYYTFNTVSGAASYTIFLWDYATASSTVFGPLTPEQVDFGTPGQGRFLQPTALALGTYTWVVNAANVAGTSPWSSYMTFSVDRIPVAPVPISPNTPGQSATPYYTFNTVPGAASYTIFLWDYATASSTVFGPFTSAQVEFGTPGQGRYLQPTTLAQGTYTWVVNAANALGTSPWSSYMTFSVDAALVAPVPISPNTPGQSATPFYTFNTVPGATSYTIFLWDYATASSTIYGPLPPAQVDFGTPGQGRFLQPTALALGTYTWVVSASNAAGTSPWSTYMTFSVDAALVAPVPISPNTPGQSATPYYTFNTVPGATSYTIFLWDYATASSTVYGPLPPAQVDFGTPGQGRFLQPTALAQGTYTWVVSASNAAGTSPWSSYMTFIVGTAPVAPVPISPNTPGQSATPYYTFNTLPGATSYTIFLWDYATASSTVFGPLTAAQVGFGTPGQGRFLQPTALEQGTYTWVVSASNAAGTSPWSTYMSFNVGAVPDAPVPISPNTPGQSPTPYYTFNTVPGAANYTIFLWDYATASSTVFGPLTAAQVDFGTPGQGRFLQPTALAQGTYTWVVSASNEVGASPWSSYMTFIVGP